MPEYDGRYEVEIIYTVTISSRVLTHHHSFDVRLSEEVVPGTVFEDVELDEKGGTIVPMGTFIQDYADVLTPLLGTTTALSEINLWRYDDEPSEARVLISSAATMPTASYAGTNIAAQCAIYTFRILGYRYPMRMYIMEPSINGETRLAASALSGTRLAYVNYVKSSVSPIVGRSDAYVNSAIAENLGQNEKLRRLRFRTE